MKRNCHRTTHRMFVLGTGYLAVLSMLAGPALAQDSTFLACGRFEDRGQRIACLEDALEAAQALPAAAGATAAAAPTASRSAQADSVRPAETAGTGDTSLLERIRNFGRTDGPTNISVDADGQDRLHDRIAALEKRNDLWIITLASGQVWRQTYARNLLLRVGDDIEIYQEGVGNAYRLATPRLSGFIRVERVR